MGSSVRELEGLKALARVREVRLERVGAVYG